MEKLNFPTEPKDWKKLKTSNKTNGLHALLSPSNCEEIKQAYISKHNSERENKVILVWITDSEKWHYLAIKRYIRLLREIT